MGVAGKNSVGNLYGLSTLCPIKRGSSDDRSFAALTREVLVSLPLNDESPLASVPNTYLARFHILEDVFFEGAPGPREHLQSQYLVFTSNFHGGLEQYLDGMWSHMEDSIRAIWAHCVGFGQVTGSSSFVEYIKKCQLTNSLLFNGSNDLPLAEQLKSLYLKQEFAAFVATNHGKSATELRQAFLDFTDRVQVDDLERPTWRPGATTLESVVVS